MCGLLIVWERIETGEETYRPEPVFVNLVGSPEIDSQPGGIDSSERLLKRLQIRALFSGLGQISQLTLKLTM
jgi:hypothetical protein